MCKKCSILDDPRDIPASEPDPRDVPAIRVREPRDTPSYWLNLSQKVVGFVSYKKGL